MLVGPIEGGVNGFILFVGMFDKDAVVFGLHQNTDQIVLGLLAPVFDHLGHVGHVFHRGDSRLCDNFGIVHIALGADHGVRPLVKALSIFLANSDHFRDQNEGQRHGDVLDEITFTLACNFIDRLIGDLLENFFPFPNHARSESSVNEASHLAVTRFVLVDEADLRAQLAGQHTLTGTEHVVVL